MNDKAPTYLENLFRPGKETNNQIKLRDSINKLAFPLPKTDCYKQSISYSGSILCNNLATFKRIVEFFFFSLEQSPRNADVPCQTFFKQYITSS